MDVHLVDGTYEPFRHFFAFPASADINGHEIGAIRGVLTSVCNGGPIPVRNAGASLT